MKVLHIEGKGVIEGDHWKDIIHADVVILNGVLVKTRDGKTGTRVDGAIFVWDERPYVGQHEAGKDDVLRGDIAGRGAGDI
jgi:hypothetical protein